MKPSKRLTSWVLFEIVDIKPVASAYKNMVYEIMLWLTFAGDRQDCTLLYSGE